MDDIVKPRCQVAQRAALPRLAGAGRARRLVHARRPHPGAGPFPQVKGSRIDHDKLRAFIGRNYEADAPALVLPERAAARLRELEAAPWVWRVLEDGGVEAHTGERLAVHDAVAGRTAAGSS
jgi:hypothetical protein